ncbi:hypothetical protein HZA40_04370 [Candidatus Peregrinibacteria bacterium]|nr:hypothetical protein [Candidatus Peregrinibacteria bacterium]
MQGIEAPSRLVVGRFFRLTSDAGDVPFDAALHDWQFQCVEEEGPAQDHSLVECYQAIEDALLNNDMELLRADAEILDLKICQIQHGIQQGIFKIDCRAGTDDGREDTFSFIVGISRREVFNDFVKSDHEHIVLLREREAAACGEATFPRHYGDAQNGKFYLYLAEFLEGYSEVNLLWGGPDFFGERPRTIVLNHLNQGKSKEYLDEADSREVLAAIARHMLITAIKCDLILTPAFRGGDYLYSPEKKALMFTCFRDAAFSPQGSGFWPMMRQKMKLEATDGFELSPEAEAVAYQFLQLLFWREDNLETAGSQYPKGLNFVFSVTDFITGDILKELPLSAAQWMQVLGILDCWHKELLKANIEHYELEKRLRDLLQILGGRLRSLANSVQPA